MILSRPVPVESGPLEWVDLPVSDPGPGEVRLTVRACGVCHTDLHTVEGDLALPLLPIIPGHQVIGIVIPIRTTVRVFPLKAANEALLALKRSQIDGTAVLMTG